MYCVREKTVLVWSCDTYAWRQLLITYSEWNLWKSKTQEDMVQIMCRLISRYRAIQRNWKRTKMSGVLLHSRRSVCYSKNDILKPLGHACTIGSYLTPLVSLSDTSCISHTHLHSSPLAHLYSFESRINTYYIQFCLWYDKFTARGTTVARALLNFEP